MFNMKNTFASTKAKIAAGTAILFAAGTASADFITDARAAITGAGADGLTIGGYVVVAIASLVVVGLAIQMLRKV